MCGVVSDSFFRRRVEWNGRSSYGCGFVTTVLISVLLLLIRSFIGTLLNVVIITFMLIFFVFVLIIFFRTLLNSSNSSIPNLLGPYTCIVGSYAIVFIGYGCPGKPGLEFGRTHASRI